MEEVSFTTDKRETAEILNFESIKIEQNEINYILNLEANEDKITFSINDKEQFPSINYNRTMSLKQIKELNSIFTILNSFNDFYDYLKSLSNSHKLNIIKDNDKITILFYVEVLLKQQKIEIDLYPTKKNLDLSIKEIYQELLNIKNKIKEIDNLKNANNNLTKENNNFKNENINLKNKINDIVNEMNLIKNENNKLNNEINNLKINNNQMNNEIIALKKENNEIKLKIEGQNKGINYLKENAKYIDKDKSVIMKGNEKDFIFKEIENKMNKRIKEMKRLYQATIDGGDPINFHSKCDNIPNTLVFVKSEGNRRFGGFTPIPWKSNGGFLQDNENKTFVFSLDNKKIYYLISGRNAVYHHKERGPCFGEGYDIGIEGNPIKENKLYTTKCSFDYKGDKQSLSEYQRPNKLKALEYEVLQIIFY